MHKILKDLHRCADACNAGVVGVGCVDVGGRWACTGAVFLCNGVVGW
jgi:hypothetical protein